MTINPRCPKYTAEREKVKKYIAAADFIDVFCMDLSVILRMQRSELDCLRVRTINDRIYINPEPEEIQKSTGLMSFLGCCSKSKPESETIIEHLDPGIDLPSMCNQVYDTIEISLQSRPLQVKSVSLHATEKRQILQVLPCTDPNVLDRLEVWNFPNKKAVELEIADLVKLEQWRMIKELYIDGFITKGAMKTLDILKKFLTTPNLSHVKLEFNTLEDPENFNRNVGYPTRLHDTWVFPIPGSDQHICVVKCFHYFIFKRAFNIQGCELELFENRLKKEWNDMEHISNREKVIKYIKDADFIDVFCMDLAVIMRNQRTELNSLKVCMYETGNKVPKRIHKSTGLLSFLGCCSRCRSASETIIEDLDPDIEVISMCSRIYDTIEISLQPRPLRVKKLELYATGKRQLLQILPYTDPNALNCLRFYRFPYHWVFREAIDLEIDDLVKLEQWGSIKKVYICGFKIKCSIENFGHFDCVQVFIEVVTVNHVLFIKERFLSTPNPLRFLLFFHKLENPDRIQEILGGSAYPSYNTREFQIPGTNQCLYVHSSKDCFLFEKHNFY
ncbi:hypothetical protein CAEBREN_16247 [Caenorhabditis brenneri]|uniref:DUF38 domain-containing protein n=1 Tax=Caenorhabditis brenneri TaxID=135651 RepID=G0N1F5_CAEBE|nr:hypothetical protein CAEBREN_16247 [Caenorhabditis brenneri]